MLTREQVKELLQKHMSKNTDVLFVDGVFMTRNANDEDAQWVRHGVVHDVDEAAEEVKAHIAAIGGNHTTTAGKLPRSLVSEIDGDTFAKILSAYSHGGIKEVVSELADQAIDNAVQTIMTLPNADEPFGTMPPEQVAEVRKLSKKLGLPFRLTMLIGAALDFDKDACNCPKCVTGRILDIESDGDDAKRPLGPAELLRRAAIQRLVERYGPVSMETPTPEQPRKPRKKHAGIGQNVPKPEGVQ